MRINTFYRRLCIVVLLLTCSTTLVVAQSDGKKNTIRFNVTNPLLFGSKAFIIGYERTIGKHQSFGVNIGRMSLPGFGKGGGSDSVSLQNNTNEKGFHLSGEYRFYLSKENKYEAPRGVYIGPYYSYNHFSRSNDWLLNTSSFQGNVNTNLALNINTIGAQLGYQFILWKRVSIDLVLLGPGLGIYKIKAGINTTLNAEQKELFFTRLNEYLKDKIPGYNLVIDEGEFKRNGSVKTTTFGFRYMVNIGFRF